MDTQIIISREDNTDFVSLGFIQTDTSLVSALGGALASFAQEIGLAADRNVPIDDSKNAINFSRFQNGILASKMIRVKEHTPVILIAIKGFEGQDKDLDFLIEYATRLAEEIVLRFESEYASIGLIPRIDDAYETIEGVATQIARRYSEKVRRHSKSLKEKVNVLLDELWESQAKFEQWANEYVQKKISYMKPSELQKELARYFYIQCIKADALIPLHLGSGTELTKIINLFLNKKAANARKEITGEITKTIAQLKDSSKALSNREMIEIPDVEFINESFMFEKVLVAKTDQLGKVVKEILEETSQDFYRKLFRKYPLNFVAMSKANVFEKDELDNVVREVMDKILKTELADKVWIAEKIATVIRQVSGKYSPNEVMKKKKDILKRTQREFIETLKKEHPFVLIANPSLEKINQVIELESEKSLDRITTTLDEAVILYNSIGQIHSTMSKEKTPSTQDLMTLYFLQQVIQPYQFREVPDIVYALMTECLAKSSYGRKGKPEEILEDSIKQFEQKLDFSVAAETKKIVTKRAAKAKATTQRFENFENLSYFFKSFRGSLETTLAKILQKIFGPEKFPLPPVLMMKTIQKIASDLQGVFVIRSIVEKLVRRPNGRDLFSSDSVKFVEKNTKFKSILPTPWELAKEAYNAGWIKSSEKKQAKITEAQLKTLTVKIPDLKLEDELVLLLEKPLVLEELWVRYASKIIDSRQKGVKTALATIEKQSKISAGSTSGKQKYGTLIKKMRGINRWLGNVVSGGGFMRKMFTGGELQQLTQDSAKDINKNFRYHPEKYSVTMDKQTIKSIANVSPIDGDFQDLIQVYASLWVADSEYIDNIIEKLFWQGLTKENGFSSNVDLSRKINQNLLVANKKEKTPDKIAAIRDTIVEEIVPAFNKIVRTALSDAFTIFKDERVVQYAEKEDKWHITLGTLNIPRTALKKVFATMPDVGLVTVQPGLTDVRLNLSKYYSLKRSKDSQTIEEFIRKAVFHQLNKKEVKALEFFSNLNEQYIGKSAADTFYSYIRALAQMILTPQ